nr:hypothetical protein GCM10020092_013480 [Actinoplanes digitatis]
MPGAGVLVRPAPSWVETAQCGRPLPGLDAGRVHVVDGGSGLGAAVAAELSERGVAATVADGRGPGGVVLLAGMASPATPEDAIDTQLAGLRLAREGGRRGVFVVVADTVARPAGAWLGGLSGLATADDGERTPVYVECERGDRGPAALAGVIADELTRGGGAQRVRLAADGTRSVGRPAEPEPSAWPGILLGSEPRIGADSVLLARDCGMALVELARETPCRLILIGDTPLADEPPGLADAHDERTILRRFAAGTGGPDGLAGMRARARALLAVREIRATIEACEAARRPGPLPVRRRRGCALRRAGPRPGRLGTDHRPAVRASAHPGGEVRRRRVRRAAHRAGGGARRDRAGSARHDRPLLRHDGSRRGRRRARPRRRGRATAPPRMPRTLACLDLPAYR